MLRRSVEPGTEGGKAQCEQMLSALHPTTDSSRTSRHVGFVPISDVAPSFDPGKHEGLLASLFRIVPAYPHIR